MTKEDKKKILDLVNQIEKYQKDFAKGKNNQELAATYSLINMAKLDVIKLVVNSY